MEDVIEERAITKLCGYVLCEKPITVVMNQRYHISLKEKKVYDVSKRKNFCSSSCFGASNYLLEQMLTSPLWSRDKEETPKFRIFTKNSLSSHGEEVDITIIKPCSTDDVENIKETEDDKEEKKSTSGGPVHNIEQTIEGILKESKSKKEEVSGNIEDFVLGTIKSMNVEKADMKDSLETQTIVTNNLKDEKIINLADNNANSSKKVQFEDALSGNKQKDLNVKCKIVESAKSTKEIIQYKNEESDIIEQQIYFVEASKDQTNSELNIEPERANKKESINLIQSELLLNCDKTSQSDVNKNVKSFKNNQNDNEVEKDKTSRLQSSESQDKEIGEKSEKSRIIKKKRMDQKVNIVVNLAAKIEQNFQEWVTEETIHFLFGDDSVKHKTIEKVEIQDRYSILCEKLNQLQFQDEQVDDEILEKPELKPAPHFAVLQEEGQKLDLKVKIKKKYSISN